MSTRVAFTSCSDPMDEPVQTVWDRIADQRPQHLVLLGDQIYMDFGILFIPSNNPHLGKPAKMEDVAFAAAMHERYARQWDIMRRSRLAQLQGLRIHGIWDDHDFAWNNSYGDGGSNAQAGPGNKRDPVSRAKQAIARRLMRDFFAALRDFEAPYPANPVSDDTGPPTEDLTRPMVCPDPAGTDLGDGVTLLLTDGRSFRTRPNAAAATVFGTAQWAAIRQRIAAADVVLFACSTTLDQGGLPLDLYGDYERLLEAAEGARLLCLTGDVHKIDWRRHDGRLFEAVASGAARTNFGLYGAFGVVEFDSRDVAVRLHLDSATPVIRRTIDRASWSEK